MQLRHKFFIVLILISSIPLLILLFGAVERMEHELSIRTNAEMHARLDKVAGEINLILQNQQATAQGLAEVFLIRRFAAMANNPTLLSKRDYAQQADALEQFFLNYQRSSPSIQALRFIDKSGKTLVKVKEGKPVEAGYVDSRNNRAYVADQSQRKFFTKAIAANKHVVMSNFELGHVNTEADFCPAMVRYSVPIRDELDNFDGVLVVNMWGRRFDSSIEATLGSDATRAYVVELNQGTSRDGIYLYHKDSAKRFANQLQSNYRLSSELTPAQWREISTQVGDGSLFLNDGRMLFFRTLSPYSDRPTKWLLVLETNYETVYAPIMRMRESIWLLLAVLLIASLLIAAWVSGSLTRPVHNLAEIIRRYADGDRSTRFQAKRTRHDEIDQAGKAFNYLTEKLESTEQQREEAVRAACQAERLVALGKLAAGIGHEINNPLLNIMSLGSLIENSLPEADTQVRSDLALLRKESKRCARIVQGILSFAREKQPVVERLELAALIEETLALLQYQFESNGIQVVKEIQAPLWMVGDPNLLQQVLVNIIVNAMQASTHNSSIRISAHEDQEHIRLVILDAGSGIDEAALPKVFDPFFTTKEEGEGTGLGLSISYGIIERHDGKLAIKNNQGSGVVVTIELPSINHVINISERSEEAINVR